MKQVLTLCLLSGLWLLPAYTIAQQVKTKTKDGKTKVKTTDDNKAIGSLNMQGAYLMTRQVINNGTGDSVTNARQLKIYTDRYYMYAHPMAGDSLAEYGIGTYAVKNGKVMEYSIFTSADGARNDTFELAINQSGNGYSQVIKFPPDSAGVTWLLTEDYQKVGKSVRSPLDGAWKQTKNMFTGNDGRTVTNANPTQYKLYQSGYFIWANTSKDSATGKPVSFYGYGTFAMNGANRVTETNTSSSYTTSLVNQPVTLQLAFTGKDGYQQTIVWPDGTRLVEVYERLK